MVDSDSPDVGDGEGIVVGEPIELDGARGRAELSGTAMTELLAIVELAATLVACTLCDADPGWLNPGRPPELSVDFSLVVDAEGDANVEDASGAPVVSSSGEYVNIGARWLVSLAVPFSTAATELDTVDGMLSLESGTVLLSVGVAFGLGVNAGVRVDWELSSVAGAGVGVM